MDWGKITNFRTHVLFDFFLFLCANSYPIVRLSCYKTSCMPVIPCIVRKIITFRNLSQKQFDTKIKFLVLLVSKIHKYNTCIHHLGKQRLEKRGPLIQSEQPSKQLLSVLLYEKMQHGFCWLAFGESPICNFVHLLPLLYNTCDMWTP